MKLLTTILLFSSLAGFGQSAAETLKKAVEYHDKDAAWSSLQGTFHFTETRPNGEDRKTIMWLDNGKSWMKLNRNDNEVYEIKHEEASVLEGGKDQARAKTLRNYYLYLWGLPMKLLDKGTPMEEEVTKETIDGTVCEIIRIPYVKDTWYFYFSQASGKLIQYKFYKDEANGKGELILLEDEYEYQGVRIPRRRSWYSLPEMKFLGTDILAEINPL